MAFDLQALKRRLQTGIDRDDLEDRYVDYANAAVREMCQRRSFVDMRVTDTLQMPLGDLKVRLFDDFKELVSQRSSVYTINENGSRAVCDVMEKGQLQRLAATFTGFPYPVYSGIPQGYLAGYRLPVFLDISGNEAFLHTTFPSNADTTFEVEYYRFLPELVADSDTNGLLQRYFETVVAKAKAIGFADTNDPISADFDALYEKKFSEAARSDAHRVLSGIRIQM